MARPSASRWPFSRARQHRSCLLSYDPAFGYELAIIVREGMRRMYVEQEDIFYYLTLYNENYLAPDMAHVLAQGALTQDQLMQGVLDGGYCFDPAQSKADIHLLASGSIMQQAIIAKADLQKLGYEVSSEYDKLRGTSARRFGGCRGQQAISKGQDAEQQVVPHVR